MIKVYVVRDDELSEDEFSDEEDYGEEIMTIKEFIDAVEFGAYTDYDGYGHPMKDGKINEECIILPSTLKILKDATHICWYNK